MNSQNTSRPSSDGTGAVRSPPAIPNFELVRTIGTGAYGEVWLARDIMGDYVALKVVYRDRFTDDRPYHREYKGIRRFRRVSRMHPSQLTVLHVGQGQGFFYYTMELADDANAAGAQTGVEGESGRDSDRRTEHHIDPKTYSPKTLRSLLREDGKEPGHGASSRRALPVERCLEIGSALASALECLHAARLVHRDIKPSNIVFVGGRPKLADIGLVAGLDDERSVVGTEGYLAPEGPGQVQADIFALGRVLYEMVTGLDVKKAPTLPEAWATRSDRRDLHALNQVVLWACDGNLGRRYKTARKLQEDLETLQANRSLRYRKLRRTVRDLGLVLAIAVPVLLVVGYGVGVYWTQAIEQKRWVALAQSEILRRFSVFNDLRAGWFTNRWGHLAEAAAIRPGDDVSECATALLAGLDAWPVVSLETNTAGSAAFSTEGICLVGQSGASGAAVLIDREGMITRLPAAGEGPVGWTDEGTPLQFTHFEDRVVLYDLGTRSARRQFALPDPGSVKVLAMTPDGSRVAVALTNRVLVWDGVTGVSLGEFPTSATALAFSPDGAQLAVGESEGFTRIYGVPSRARLAELPAPAPGKEITCLAFGRNLVVRREATLTANPWLLATGDNGGGIVIWDLDQQLPKCFCRGSTWTVSALVLDPDGLTLASAGRSEPRLWDVATGELLLLLEDIGAGNARALAFDGTGRRLVCGGERGASYSARPRVILWELEPHRGIETLRGLSSAARRVWFSADSQRVAAVSDDWHLAVWDLACQRLLFIFETPNGVFADQAGGCFDLRGERFAFATWNEARVYDLETGTTVSQWTLPEGLGDQLEYDTDGRLLLLRREWPVRVSGEIARVWRLYELGKSPEPVRLHQQTETNWWAEGLLFQPGGKRFAVWNGGRAGTNRTVRMFEVNHGHEVWKRETAYYKGELRMCFDPGGNWFGYQSDAPYRQRLVKMQGLEEMGFSKHGFEAISPSGRNFAACRTLGRIPLSGGLSGNDPLRRREASVLWLFRDGADPIPLVATGNHLTWVSAFSPDGRLLAWGTEEGVVHVAHIDDVAKRLAELNARGTQRK